MPSQETLRQRLGLLSKRDWQDVVDACVAWQLSHTKLTRVGHDGLFLIPVDIDVSVLEDTASRKEGISRTYHNVDGYAPIFCHAGSEGYMVANELRPGRQHSAKGAVEFLKRCIRILLKAGYEAEELLVRVDSGHDASDFSKALEGLGVHYLVKRNPRAEDLRQLLDSIRNDAETRTPRPGKKVFHGTRADRKPAEFAEDAHFGGFMVVEGIERTSLANGQGLLIPEIEVDSWWTNLPFSVGQCVALYHDHGTSEQFHSELKSDMGVELLPSGTFAVNSLVLGLAAIAFNCLRFIGQKALPHQTPSSPSRALPLRHRLRIVLLDFIKVGCKVVKHAGQTLLKFGRNCHCFTILKEIYANC